MQIVTIFHFIAIFVLLFASYKGIRAYLEKRYPSILLYASSFIVTAALISIMTIDMFGDFTITIEGETEWITTITNSFLIPLSVMLWYLAVTYSKQTTLGARHYFLLILIGASIMFPYLKYSIIEKLMYALEVSALIIVLFEISLYITKMIKLTKSHRGEEIKSLYMFLIGTILFFGSGAWGLGTNLIRLPYLVEASWLIMNAVGVLLVAFAISKNYRVLYISEARPLTLIILKNDSTTLYTYEFEKTSESLDPILVSGAISGIITLLSEIMHTKTGLNRIDYEENKILLEYGKSVIGVLITYAESLVLRYNLRRLIKSIEEQYISEIDKESSSDILKNKINSLVVNIF